MSTDTHTEHNKKYRKTALFSPYHAHLPAVEVAHDLRPKHALVDGLVAEQIEMWLVHAVDSEHFNVLVLRSDHARRGLHRANVHHGGELAAARHDLLPGFWVHDADADHDLLDLRLRRGGGGGGVVAEEDVNSTENINEE